MSVVKTPRIALKDPDQQYVGLYACGVSVLILGFSDDAAVRKYLRRDARALERSHLDADALRTLRRGTGRDLSLIAVDAREPGSSPLVATTIDTVLAALERQQPTVEVEYELDCDPDSGLYGVKRAG
jgi:hypothetical protein